MTWWRPWVKNISWTNQLITAAFVTFDFFPHLLLPHKVSEVYEVVPEDLLEFDTVAHFFIYLHYNWNSLRSLGSTGPWRESQSKPHTWFRHPTGALLHINNSQYEYQPVFLGYSGSHRKIDLASVCPLHVCWGVETCPAHPLIASFLRHWADTMD